MAVDLTELLESIYKCTQQYNKMNAYLDDDNNIAEPSAHEVLREAQLKRAQRYKKFRNDTILYTCMYGFVILAAAWGASFASLSDNLPSMATGLFVQFAIIAYNAISLYKELKVSLRGMYENRKPR